MSIPEYSHELVLLKSNGKIKTDRIGNQIKGDDKVTCLCATTSISGSEFYRAGQAGIKPSITARMNQCEYSGQLRCTLDGTMYNVVRTYNVNRDEVELTLEPKAGNR